MSILFSNNYVLNNMNTSYNDFVSIFLKCLQTSILYKNKKNAPVGVYVKFLFDFFSKTRFSNN